MSVSLVEEKKHDRNAACSRRCHSNLVVRAFSRANIKNICDKFWPCLWLSVRVIREGTSRLSSNILVWRLNWQQQQDNSAEPSNHNWRMRRLVGPILLSIMTLSRHGDEITYDAIQEMKYMEIVSSARNQKSDMIWYLWVTDTMGDWYTFTRPSFACADSVCKYPTVSQLNCKCNKDCSVITVQTWSY